MTPEEKRAYQNGLICGLSVRSVMDTADGHRKAILADMTEINQTMPANSTWEAIHKAIRSWNISGPRVSLVESLLLSALAHVDSVGILIDTNSTPLAEFLGLAPITTNESVIITLT